MCVGAEALRARSAALSKVIVRTEQNNFAGGGAVAGLVLRAPVEQMLWAPKTHHDILYRMLRTRQKAAPRRSPESWGAQNVPRNRAVKCPPTRAPKEHFKLVFGSGTSGGKIPKSETKTSDIRNFCFLACI